MTKLKKVIMMKNNKVKKNYQITKIYINNKTSSTIV